MTALPYGEADQVPSQVPLVATFACIWYCCTGSTLSDGSANGATPGESWLVMPSAPRAKSWSWSPGVAGSETVNAPSAPGDGVTTAPVVTLRTSIVDAPRTACAAAVRSVLWP